MKNKLYKVYRRIMLEFFNKRVSLHGLEKAFKIAYEHGIKKGGNNNGEIPCWDEKVLQKAKKQYYIDFNK